MGASLIAGLLVAHLHGTVRALLTSPVASVACVVLSAHELHQPWHGVFAVGADGTVVGARVSPRGRVLCAYEGVTEGGCLTLRGCGTEGRACGS